MIIKSQQILELHIVKKPDITELKSCLLHYINRFKLRGCINQMTINTISCMSNMTYEYYMKQPMQSVELRLNLNIPKNTSLINSFD